MRHACTMSDTLAYLVSVKGRINRTDYVHCLFLGVLLALMVGLPAAFVSLVVASIVDLPPGKAWWVDPKVYALIPAFLIGGGVWLTAMIRRWHDIGVSAWLAILLFVLMLGTDWDLLILLLPALIPGNAAGNAYGPAKQVQTPTGGQPEPV